MKLHLAWKEVALTDVSSKGDLIYSADPRLIPAKPGIYVFGRFHGSRFEALYVGKAKDLQSRIKGQLKNLRLMRCMQRSKTGKRVVCVAEFRSRQGQQEDRCLRILERTFIQYFHTERHALVNVHGTRFRHGGIWSERSTGIAPPVMNFEIR